MTAETIDPNILHPDAEIGRATGVPSFYDVVIAAINDHASLIDGVAISAGLRVYNVADYGPTTTPALTRTAMLAAAAAADADGGGLVYWSGTLTVEQDGANAWCVDWPYDNVGLIGDGSTSVLKAEAGMPAESVSLIRMNALTDISVSGIVFDGNWGNRVTAIEEGSHAAALPQATIYVGDTTNMATSGVFTIRLHGDSYQYITYTGKTATTLTGCTGGTGTMTRDDPVVYSNSAAGLNHSTQADPKNHALFIRGCSRVLIERCTFRDMYGDGVWLGMPADDDLFQPSKNIRIIRNVFDTTARNGISFGAGVEDVEITSNVIRNIWTCGIDSEPQGFNTRNRDITIHSNSVSPWPIFPGGGFAQAIGCVAGTPQGYNQSSAARGWRIHDNFLYGWTAINNSIDVEFSSNQVRTRFDSLGDTIVSAINTGTETFTAAGHGLQTGNGPVWILATTTLPAGLTASSGNPLRSIDYWAIRVDADNFRLATTFAVALTGTTDVNVTSSGAGTITQTGPKLPAPIYVDHASDDIRILNNYVYDNSEKSQFSGEGHNGSIEVANYASANINLQPAGVTVKGNQIHSHKSVHGIFVNSQGGFSTGDGAAVIAPLAGTATSVTRNTLFHSGSPFGSTDSWAGWQVIMSGCVGLIKENTADTLTLYTPDLPVGSAIGWRDATGEWVPTPAAGAFVITSTSGVLNIEDNAIDCSAYADHTAGGHGIRLFNDRAGSRIVCRGNKIKNANTYGIQVEGAASKPALYISLLDNIVWDDQAVATCTAAIQFATAASSTSIVKLVMRGNSTAGGLSTVLSGVAAGYWLVSDGDVQQWAGYGSPNTVITAPLGSTYQRKDGGAGTSFYVNEDGATAWAAK